MKKMTIRQKAEAVLHDERFTSYQISKDTGIAISPLQRRRTAEELNLDTMSLYTAEKLAQFYDDQLSGKELIDPPAEDLPKGTPVWKPSEKKEV